jgi:hypothetical protein
LLEDVFPLEPHEALQRLTALARHWPAMPVLKWGVRSKTWEILPLEAISLSVGIDPATGADTLGIRDTRYSHPALDEPVEFYARSADTKDIERMEFLESDNNRDYGDYDPIAKFEAEWKEESRTPPRLYSTTAAPPPTSETASAVSEVATLDASPEVQDVDPFNTGAGGRPSAKEFVLSEARRRISDGKVEVRHGKQGEFADALADWWEKERNKCIPPKPKLTAKTIRNSPEFRSLWRQALAAKSQNPPPENPETN